MRAVRRNDTKREHKDYVLFFWAKKMISRRILRNEKIPGPDLGMILYFCINYKKMGKIGRSKNMQKGESMEDGFKVIDGYLMVKLPEEIDHHQASCISKSGGSDSDSGKGKQYRI